MKYKENLPLLNSSKFYYKNSFNCNMVVTPIEFDYGDNKHFYVHHDWKLIGYTKNPHNNRKNHLGVMFENKKSFEQLWCHIDPYTLKEIAEHQGFIYVPDMSFDEYVNNIEI